MPLFWNEIRDRALFFSREWATECSEDAEAKSFWDGFSTSSVSSAVGWHPLKLRSGRETARGATSTCYGKGCCWSNTSRAVDATYGKPPSKPRLSGWRSCLSVTSSWPRRW